MCATRTEIEILEVRMRKLILATASAIALGIAGAAPLYAADNDATANPAPAAPAATQTPATGTMQPATPQAGATMQQNSPSMNGNDQMSGNNQPNNADQANASQSNVDWPRVSRSDVQQVQQKLQQDGLYRGKIDGLSGPGNPAGTSLVPTSQQFAGDRDARSSRP